MRSRIIGSRDRPIVGELSPIMQIAWERGWRPRVGPSHRLWCLAGCGASLYTRDQEVFSFTCLACRHEAHSFVANPQRDAGPVPRSEAQADPPRRAASWGLPGSALTAAANSMTSRPPTEPA
jgi:hypothetical protein